MMANWVERRLSSARLQSAGRSLRLVRSPLAPKITITQGEGVGFASEWLRLMKMTSSSLTAEWNSNDSVSGLFFDVSAELKAHRGQNFSRKIIFAAGGEALVERSAEYRCWCRRFDGREDGPAAFARVGHAAGEAFKGGLLQQGNGGQIEQPGCNNAAAAPNFGDVREIEIVLIVFRVAQRSGFRVGLAVGLAGVGVLQDVQALSVGGHQAILDSVVHHLDEVARAGWAAMEVSFLGRPANFIPPGCTGYVAATRCEGFENRIEALHDVRFAADHLAISSFEPPDAAAGADVAIMDSFRGEFFGAADVINVVRVSAVDDDVVLLQLARQIVQRGINHRRRHHQPDRAWLLKFLDEIAERTRAGRAFIRQLLHRIGAAVIHDALVAAFLQAPNHVRAHPSQSDHAKLHRVSSSASRVKENLLAVLCDCLLHGLGKRG